MIQMQNILNQLKIPADVISIENNGTISKYYIHLKPGAKVTKIENCATEIALELKAYGKPIIRTIMNRGLVVIEALHKPIEKINFNKIVIPQNDMKLPLILGRTHSGDDLIVDLTEMPHLLIAGTTGSGKSVLLHSIIHSLILKENIRLALIDPKMVEFSYYNHIKQLGKHKIATSCMDSLYKIKCLINEMEYRFKQMNRKSVNNIEDFNSVSRKKFPYIVLIIDEFSDLVQNSEYVDDNYFSINSISITSIINKLFRINKPKLKSRAVSFNKIFQKNLCTLAQKSRACGIHIIVATQRPSTDVITGIIKANFPTRISCKVSSLVDSRVILDCSGAEKLLGKGDSILRSDKYDMVRFQGAYIKPKI